MSKEKLKGKCSRCRNLQVVREQAPPYPMFPAPEVPMVSYRYKCKVTNESLSRGEVETERECEHFKEIGTVLCSKCGALNPIEYNFCGNCGLSMKAMKALEHMERIQEWLNK